MIELDVHMHPITHERDLGAALSGHHRDQIGAIGIHGRERMNLSEIAATRIERHSRTDRVDTLRIGRFPLGDHEQTIIVGLAGEGNDLGGGAHVIHSLVDITDDAALHGARQTTISTGHLAARFQARRDREFLGALAGALLKGLFSGRHRVVVEGSAVCHRLVLLCPALVAR